MRLIGQTEKPNPAQGEVNFEQAVKALQSCLHISIGNRSFKQVKHLSSSLEMVKALREVVVQELTTAAMLDDPTERDRQSNQAQRKLHVLNHAMTLATLIEESFPEED